MRKGVAYTLGEKKRRKDTKRGEGVRRLAIWKKGFATRLAITSTPVRGAEIRFLVARMARLDDRREKVRAPGVGRTAALSCYTYDNNSLWLPL